LKIDIKPYKHFSFDLWLTLIKSNPLFKKKRNILFRDFFAIECDEETVSSTIRKYDVLCNKISEKTGRHIDFNHIYCLILNDLKINIDIINKGQLDEFYNLSEKLFFEYMPELIFPRISLLLKQIQSEGKTTNILSNTAFIQGTTLRKVISLYELSDYFSFQLYSDEIGFSKPNALSYERVFENTKQFQPVIKNDIVHIGDNKYADFEGATKYGFSAILI
jgi:putative hydrolase of the HAD superfamily